MRWNTGLGGRAQALTHWGYIRVILGLYWGSIGAILGLYGVILGILGLY